MVQEDEVTKLDLPPDAKDLTCFVDPRVVAVQYIDVWILPENPGDMLEAACAVAIIGN